MAVVIIHQAIKMAMKVLERNHGLFSEGQNTLMVIMWEKLKNFSKTGLLKI
jgi:hypothetical protein